ncbi:MAG: NRDE family protein [Bryobacteraceae bacterium]
MSWLWREDGYELFANRDELRTRGIALPPAIRERAGVSYIAPADADFGGTWIAINQFGISFCLLNRPRKRDYGSARSRGLLVLDLTPQPTVQATSEQLQRENLRPYPPFALAVLGPAQEPLVFEWDGEELRVDQVERPPYLLTSSSFDPGGVAQNRIRQFVEVRGVAFDANSRAELMALHRSHAPEAGPYSVCMHRDDAETVSFSHVVVDGEKITFSYTPAAPCKAATAAVTTLPMVRPNSLA